MDTAELSCCPEREGLAAKPRSSGPEASRDGAISLAESTASMTQALVAGPFATATATAEAETARARPSAAAAATALTAVSFAKEEQLAAAGGNGQQRIATGSNGSNG